MFTINGGMKKGGKGATRLSCHAAQVQANKLPPKQPPELSTQRRLMQVTGARSCPCHSPTMSGGSKCQMELIEGSMPRLA